MTESVVLRQMVDRDGFLILPAVFDPSALTWIVRDLQVALNAQSEREGSIRASRGRVYAARNLFAVWPGVVELARGSVLRNAMSEILGFGCGLVRALYFDKPPGRSWSLPWHKDMTIAVLENRRPSEHFPKPTTKAGVPHVEAPRSVLENMLTARVHLDDVTDENGPLLVVPGSHRTGKEMRSGDGTESEIRPILVSAGDVLLMRPLVIHSSGNSREGTERHRRIVHLEFASAEPLPDSYRWHDFQSLTEDRTR